MKKTLALLCSLGLFVSTAAHAYELSEWAKADYELISRGGILTKEIITGDFKQAITRAEVASMMVNLYSQISDNIIEEIENPFTDTDSSYVLKAYSAGIVSGKGGGIFDPHGEVTRQEFAKMLLNTLQAAELAPETDSDEISDSLSAFDDSADIADWAKEAFFVALSNEIINGTSEKTLSPKGGALREQAICIVGRAYKRFAEELKEYPTPEFSGSSILDEGNIMLKWAEANNALSYYVVLRDEKGELWEAFQTKSNRTTLYDADYLSGKYSVIIGADLEDGVETFSNPADFSVTAPAITPPVTALENLSTSEKEARVFPAGTAFTTAEEAKQNMTEVTIPVWRINGNGEKYSREVTIEVNSALADDVVNIFTEIFNSPEQFPIKAVSGYSWRNTSSGRISHHSYGTCIDINPNENYFVDTDGTPITGEFWKPYENPYSMPEDGIVVRTFAKYGWEWGGNCWSDKYAKDYMHFTYLGK